MAVGEDEEQRARPIVRIELDREVDGIAQRRRAARLQARQRRSDGLPIGRHRYGQRDLMRERDERRVVVGSQRRGERVARLHQLRQPLADETSAAVEDERHVERQAIDHHALDLLRDAVVGQREVV